ncbi:hypothetical protein CYLTODRAFT_403115 [Cylindrobasidium torrendii FP15055 ss-10]|uniref:ICE2-domain-containing protein n=1 Tax=Cylindrobasidium torrendii FP15055 ss-10 TaxID=1314674 RepID=A0A0D7AZX4_9AGAR|nr:hypothetical protein CYLTODRAFT_403115 [Cylindrobasidium torrendii FP15055 ss-10]
MNPWLLWSAVSHTARLSTVLQILIFLPLTLVTLSKSACLLLSLLLSTHALIHGTMVLFWGSPALSFLQVPMHPFLLLVCFNAFSSTAQPWLLSATSVWGTILTYLGPLFIAMEGLSSLIVSQRLGQYAKDIVEEGEVYQFLLLIVSAIAYVGSAYWIIISYPAAAASPLSSTFLGVAITALLFITFIGFVLRRTNIIETSGMATVIAFNVWLCGFDPVSYSGPSSSFVPLLPISGISTFLPYLETLISFVKNTLPKPVLVALLYRLGVLQFASKILPGIGADSWEHERGVDNGWEDRPTKNLTHILLTYRQLIFVTVYSHLLLLEHSSQVWWRWFNIFFMLFLWSLELFVSNEDDIITKDWKVD